MYQDVYTEESVSRVTPKMTTILNIFLVIFTVFVALEFIFIDYKVFGIPLVAMVIVCYFAFQNSQVDFDYVYTNGLLEITKVFRKRKRKDLICCEMKDVVVMAKSKTEPVKPYIGKSMKTYDCTSHESNVAYYTMIVRSEKHGGEIKILFEPGEELLDIMHRMCPDKVHVS